MADNVVINEVSLNLSKFIKHILPSVLDAGMEKACQIVETDAKDKCSFDEGTLTASIGHNVIPYAGIGIVGTNLDYAVYVHRLCGFIQ